LRVLVTGGDGFTGCHFITAATSAGLDVVCLSANLRDEMALRQEILSVQPNYVVHLAAISYVANANKSDFYSVNVIGTVNLLKALTNLPIMPVKVLLASSANIYGNCVDSPINENQVPSPINDYAMSKLAMEYMSKPYFDSLPIIITRPFNYVGVGQDKKFVIPKLVDHFLRREQVISLGNINVEREFNDVHMVVDMYLKLLESGVEREVYNICSGKTYSLRSVISLISKITQHEIMISVDETLVRPNEIGRLCGDPSKILSLYPGKVAPPVIRSLETTLTDMLTGNAT